MIDWSSLAFNSLWVLGCALILATLSYASWQAAVKGEKLRARLSQPGAQKWISLAGVLFCAGLAGTSQARLEIVLWAVLGALFFVQLVHLILRARRATTEITRQE